MPGGIIPPPSVYLSWPKPNYVDPVTEGPALVVVGIILSSIAILLVAARIYSRIFITRAPGIDDLLILISLACSIALTVLVIIGNKSYGSGRHVWDVSPSQAVGNRLNAWAAEWCYMIATCSVKISILLFYRRLSSSFSRGFFIATWIGIAYNVAFFVTFVFVIAFICRPVEAIWLQLDPEWAKTHKFTCTNEHITLPVSVALSVLGDFYSALLPCILILKLDLPRRQKLALYPLFVLGFLAVAAGIIRTYIINYLINETYDSTWYLWKFWVWTLVEVYFAILAASAPALKPLFLRFLVDPITSRKGGSYTHARDYKTNSHKGREAQRKLWSNTSSTTPLEEGGAVEKIGMAAGGDGTKRYELRTLPSGKVEPVPVNVGPRKILDLQSDSQAGSLYPKEQSEWALPQTSVSNDSSMLRSYHAGIDALPPFPGPGRTTPVVGYATERRSVTPRQDQDDSDVEYVGSKASPSNKTLQLPKQGRANRDSGVYDDESLRLPRQRIADLEAFRASKVRRAV